MKLEVIGSLARKRELMVIQHLIEHGIGSPGSICKQHHETKKNSREYAEYEGYHQAFKDLVEVGAVRIAEPQEGIASYELTDKGKELIITLFAKITI